jgi:murein DD-endopeptidase MepM/ murein hydrolase activator NlpD
MAASLAAEPARSQATGGYHVVQRGETLSSIAAKYLGSAARYQELYQSNADRLRDANDLRVGMELRIPAAAAQSPAPTRTAAAEDRRLQRDGTATARPLATEASGPGENAADSADVPVRFEPYRRSPLTPQGTEPQSSTFDAKDSARRRLTQLPPRGDVSPPR